MGMGKERAESKPKQSLVNKSSWNGEGIEVRKRLDHTAQQVGNGGRAEDITHLVVWASGGIWGRGGL